MFTKYVHPPFSLKLVYVHLIFCLLSFSNEILADSLPPNCLQSFQGIRKNAFIVYYGWLPGNENLKFVQPLSCEEAEFLRQRLFNQNEKKAISDKDIEKMLAEPNPLNNIRNDLLKAKDDVNQKKTPDDFRLWLDVQLFAISKNQVIVGCLLAETPAGAALCGLGVIQLSIAGYDLFNKLKPDETPPEKRSLSKKIDEAIWRIDQLIATGSYKPNSLSQVKKKLLDIQIKLCMAIQKECLESSPPLALPLYHY